MRGWVGFDLDGTIAHYDGFEGPDVIGEPIESMIALMKLILSHDEYDVKIFTARVSPNREKPDEADIARAAIEAWCEEHVGQKLEVTHCKDYGMVLLYDDRAAQVERNTGRVFVVNDDA